MLPSKSNKYYIFWVCVSAALVIQCENTWALLYCYLWPLRLYYIVPHYLTNGTILRKTLLHIKCVFIFSIFVSKAFPILRTIQLKNITNARRSSCNVKYLDRFSKNTQISNFTKIRPVEAKFSYADGQTDMTKLTVAFRNFANAPKNCTIVRNDKIHF